MLPDVLYRIILTYAGSIRYDDQNRRKKFVKLELKIWNLLIHRGAVKPSDMVRYYRDHGRRTVERIINDAFMIWG